MEKYREWIVHRLSTNHLPAHKDALPRGYLSLQTTLSRPRSAREQEGKKKGSAAREERNERTCILSGYSGSYWRRFRQRIPLLSSYLRYVADKLYGILGALSYPAFVCRRSMPACVWIPAREQSGALHADTTGNRAFAQVAAKKILYARVDRSRSHWHRARRTVFVGYVAAPQWRTISALPRKRSTNMRRGEKAGWNHQRQISLTRYNCSFKFQWFSIILRETEKCRRETPIFRCPPSICNVIQSING